MATCFENFTSSLSSSVIYCFTYFPIEKKLKAADVSILHNLLYYLNALKIGQVVVEILDSMLSRLVLMGNESRYSETERLLASCAH